jgi:hypothetical protein
MVNLPANQIHFGNSQEWGYRYRDAIRALSSTPCDNVPKCRPINNATQSCPLNAASHW